MSEELKWNRKQMGMVLAMFFWGYMCSQYSGGYISDRFGGDRVIPRCSMAWSLLTLTFVWIPDLTSDPERRYAIFLLARFALGMASGFFYPSTLSLMSKCVEPQKRQFTYALLSSGSHIGTLLCGLVGSILLETNGWRVSFHMIGVLSFVWALFLHIHVSNTRPVKQVVVRLTSCGGYSTYDEVEASLKKDLPIEFQSKLGRKALTEYGLLGYDEKTPGNFKENIVRLTEEHDQTDKATRYRPLDWSKLLLSPAYWSMQVANFAHSNTFYVLLNWLPTYFHDNFPDARSWVFNFTPWMIISASVVCGGYLADELLRRKYSLITVRKLLNTIVLGVSSLLLFALSFSEEYITSLVLMSLAIASGGFHNCAVLLNPLDIAPNHGGQVYGSMSTIGAIPGFVGVYLAGYILETTHKWSYVFYSTAAVNMVGWLAFTMFGKAEPIV